jgi:hypothetical protein
MNIKSNAHKIIQKATNKEVGRQRIKYTYNTTALIVNKELVQYISYA